MDFPECQELYWVYTGVLWWCALHPACDIIDNRVGSWDWSWCCEIVNPKCKGGLVRRMAGVLYEAPIATLDTGHFWLCQWDFFVETKCWLHTIRPRALGYFTAKKKLLLAISQKWEFIGYISWFDTIPAKAQKIYECGSPTTPTPQWI